MWQLLITGIFGLLAGLGGVTLQSFLQRRDKADERTEARRQLRRDKAEAVFEELNRLVATYAAQVIHAMQRMMDKEVTAPDAPSAARLDALLSIYFPACVPHLEKFNTDARAIYEATSKHLGEVIDKGGGAKDIAGVHMIMAQQLQNRSITFADALRGAMRAEIDKLW